MLLMAKDYGLGTVSGSINNETGMTSKDSPMQRISLLRADGPAFTVQGATGQVVVVAVYSVVLQWTD